MYFSVDLKFVLDDREMESIDAILVLKYQVEKKINTYADTLITL